MARVRMDELIEHCSAELCAALTRVLWDESPDVDANRIFEAFKRAAKSSLGGVSVPDSYVDRE